MTGLLRQEMRCVLVIDMVESVRLMAADEAGTVARWLEIVAHVRDVLLPREGGRMVKSLGDGMLLQFDTALSAIRVALGCQAFASAREAGLPAERQIRLQQGLEMTDVLVGPDDIYGHGVNMASRLAGLGRAGDIVASQEVRDRLTPDVHADFEDLGECFVKHVEEPVRAYRAGPPGGSGRPAVRPAGGFGNLLPVIAVIPFRGAGADAAGEVLAEELIAALSKSARMNVISRLTTTQLSHERWNAREFGRNLRANFVLTGSCREDRGRLMAELELAETRGGEVIWKDRVGGGLGDLLSGDQVMVASIVDKLGEAIVKNEIRRTEALPLPNLEAYSLLLGAIGTMYRLSRREFERARLMLDALIERVPRHPLPLAWMGNWHVLKVQQGWSENSDREQRMARGNTERALDLDPENDTALTFDGFVHTNLMLDPEGGEARYIKALERNPSASLAWLLRGVAQAFKGNGEPAVEFTDRAMSLSPYDPQRFFYTSLAASANYCAGRHEDAKRLAIASLRDNRAHTSTLRVLAASQWLSGEEEAARKTGRELVALEPSLNVTDWLRRSPSAETPQGAEMASILKKIGIPE
ncbi:MAG: adenylate/guanylate cyclase domain-containing protein [Paracoccaceae bacterium]